ncbi:lysine-specific demethylase JMJ28 [Prosopis cineraria]|uniref:lysine-specific demethylase JMJ28 n=1 Tax=Prosopis cineraria TaxID=364024 RepID=UPI00240FA386|nr:lysine-specific demethylase JMJ28 [Prosopis cineraria]
MVEEEEVLPDHLRCSRTDGRQWRCRRRVMDNLKLCQIHYLQGRHRQYKEKVPESLKLQRKRKNGNNDSKDDSVNLDNVEIRALKVGKKANLIKKRRKFWDSSEAVNAHPVKKKALKQGGMQLDLIRMVLKREIEKRKKKEKQGEKRMKKSEEEELINYSEGELTRELPNGVMAISPASTPRDYNNVGSQCDVKVGIDHKAITPRYFRSKNVERLPAGKLQVLPFGRNLKKLRRKKCHWCQKSESWNLIKCSSCQKEFFCMDCSKDRYFETQNEVKMACPVCRGTCSCKECLASRCKDSESKEYLPCKSRVDRILCFHYMICMLLPVLKQISADHNIELEAEVKNKGKRSSGIQIKQVEFGCNEQNCWKPTKLKDRIADENHILDEVVSNGNSAATSSSPDCTTCKGSGNRACSPTELGGCDDSLLDLRCVFPISLMKEMETKAEEIACCYDFPEALDKSSSCSLCLNTDNKIDRYKQWQEAALREDSNDNCLFYPTVLNISHDNFEHFQKHWGKGHPVVVRDALQSKSNHIWDPLVMFCAYLEQSIVRYQNDKDLLESCLDWCEVEINIRQFFAGSLRCQPQKNTWHEMLKLKGWLSSQLFKEQFPIHFAQVIDALPLPEYMNPMSGILNLAANLPQGQARRDIGPFVYMSYGCSDEQADSVTKLCYDSYDVVNIMMHSTDIPLSTEQLTKIRKLLKKHRNLCQRESPEIITEQITGQCLKGNSVLHAEDEEQNEVQSMVREEMNFFRRVNRTTSISMEAIKAASRSTDSIISQGGECDSDSDSDLKSTALHGTVQNTLCSTHNNHRYSDDSSNNDRNKNLDDHSGAQWDVFRRQDVPKLMEYLKRHCIEFSDTRNYKKKVIHPILDQIFFLDDTHKMRLKEEFEIEPWTFAQHVGEAVIIPAGCPYQIRNPKCSVHVILEFVSPENVNECFELFDEVCLRPEGHKAKADKLEMKKMALYSMRTAIKEIGDLTCKK